MNWVLSSAHDFPSSICSRHVYCYGTWYSTKHFMSCFISPYLSFKLYIHNSKILPLIRHSGIHVPMAMFMELPGYGKPIVWDYPVHFKNGDWAQVAANPGPSQPYWNPSQPVKAATVFIIPIYYYYSAQKLIFNLPSYKRWKAKSTWALQQEVGDIAQSCIWKSCLWSVNTAYIWQT